MEGNKSTGQPGNDTSLLNMTSDIVSAYLANTHNNVRPDDVASLINTVHTALLTVSSGGGSGSREMQQSASPQRGEPPVSIKKSITADYLISLEDGKPYKSLKRHLSGRDLTPEQYRAKWGLPPNYPMVAPNYAKARSDLAKQMGLGQKRQGAAKKTAKKTTGRGRKKAD
jgi:predicted transcriptional regulator